MFSNDKEIRNIQEQLLGVLRQIHNCCMENRICYSLHGGTLLGAIREKGFISWDDDADISMTRRNYERFLDVIKTDNTYHLFITHFNQVTQIVSSEFPDVWVDVFVYDFITTNTSLQKIKYALLVFMNVCVKPRGMLNIRKAIYDYPAIVRFFYDAIYVISGFFPIGWRRTLREFIASKCLSGDRTLMFKSNDQIKGLKETFPRDVMKKYTLTVFESTKLMISKDYEVMLTTSYGKDYMTPVKYDAKESNVHVKMRGKMGLII